MGCPGLVLLVGMQDKNPGDAHPLALIAHWKGLPSLWMPIRMDESGNAVQPPNFIAEATEGQGA